MPELYRCTMRDHGLEGIRHNCFQTMGENEGTEGEDSSVPDAYSRKWGWLAMVSTVSETTRLNWNQVFELTVIEFLNIASFAKDTAEREKQQIEQWKRRNT